MVPLFQVLLLKLLGALTGIFVLDLNDPEFVIGSLGSSLYYLTLDVNFCYSNILYISNNIKIFSIFYLSIFYFLSILSIFYFLSDMHSVKGAILKYHLSISFIYYSRSSESNSSHKFYLK